MLTSPPRHERPTLSVLVAAPDYASKVCAVVSKIEGAADAAEAITLLKQACQRLGAEAAIFVSFIRDDAIISSYRSLLACDPLIGIKYAHHDWAADDPWLIHAMHCSEPIRTNELAPVAPFPDGFAETTMHHGFRSAVIVPAPCAAGHSRVGMLCLGSSTPDYFDDAAYPQLRCLARALAMELNQWMHRCVKAELLAESKITEDDLELLRFEQRGMSSKAIAAALYTEAKTIDCRFQRVNQKLRMPNRRAATRLAELYGLI